MDKQLRQSLVADWGADLPPDHLTEAILAAGLAEHAITDRQRWGLGALDGAALLNEVRKQVVQALDEDQFVRWSWPSLDIIDMFDARDAYAAITRLPMRVAIQPTTPWGSISAQLQPVVQMFTKPSRAVTAFVEETDRGGWGYGLVSWPLRIGFATDPTSQSIEQALDRVLSHPELIESVDAGPCDVLVIGSPMSELLSDGLGLSDGPFVGSDTDPDSGPTLVIAIGELDIDGSDADTIARAIMNHTNSVGVHLCACGPQPGAAWLNQFIEHLSHDEPVDRALMSADDWLYGVGYSLLGDRAIESMRLSFIVSQVREWFWAKRDLAIEVSDSIRDRLPDFPAVTQVTSGEIADYLRDHADRFQYDHESQEATGIAGIVRSAGGLPEQVIWGAGPPEMLGPDPADEHGPRRLGADVIVDGHVLEQAFVADVPNLVRVTIGRTATHQTGEGLPEPDFEDKDEVELPVWARAGGSVHDGSITLPRDRRREATKPFEFEVTPTAGERVEIEIVVYQPDAHNVLQAALLCGDVADSLTDEANALESISIVVVDVQSFTAAPSAAPRGSIVHSSSGGLVTGASDPVPIAIDAAAARQWTTDTVADIEKGAAGEEMLDIPIEELLVQLAGRGAVRLSKLSELHPFIDFPRIQVVSLVKHDVFPIEFLYSGPKPVNGAQLCSNWRESLRQDECPTCSATGPLDGSTVCPSQFWSMSKVIEHHGPADGPNTVFSVTGFRTLEQDRIGPLEPVLIGVSKAVLEVEPTALTDLSDALGSASEATDWGRWTELIEQTTPGLLIAMPHQEQVIEFGTETPALELGGQFESTFSEAYVTNRAAPPGPVMLLLGCNTAVGGGRALSSFASIFRSYGASLVVSSLGEVIAKQAPLAASAFLSNLAGVLAQSPGSLGEVLLKTRRTLLADGKLLPLMLVNHGDPDWSVL